MNPNVDFLGIVQMLNALRGIGFSELELRKIASRIAVELGAGIAIFP